MLCERKEKLLEGGFYRSSGCRVGGGRYGNGGWESRWERVRVIGRDLSHLAPSNVKWSGNDDWKFSHRMSEHAV